MPFGLLGGLAAKLAPKLIRGAIGLGGKLAGKAGRNAAKKGMRAVAADPISAIGTGVGVAAGGYAAVRSMRSRPGAGYSDPFGNQLAPGTGMTGATGSTKGMTKDGRPRRIRQDGKPYKRPTMNSANPKALRRAVRRVDGFRKLAKSVGFSRPPKSMKGVQVIRTRRKCK